MKNATENQSPKKTKSQRRKPTVTKPKKGFSFGMSLLLFIILSTGIIYAQHIFKSRYISTMGKESTSSVATKMTFEVFPAETVPVDVHMNTIKEGKEGKEENKPQVKKEEIGIIPQVVNKDLFPKIALIIDDLGYDLKIAHQLMLLHPAITLSILPMSPYGKQIAIAAHAQHTEILLHLPMEPIEYPKIHPGPGALMMSMSSEELRKQLETDLQRIPFFKGANNHMGSRLTADELKMTEIFQILKEQQLFFIDSRTTFHSVCQSVGNKVQLPVATRDVFIDHELSKDYIRHQIHELITLAQKNGKAIGIGHPHAITYTILAELLPEMIKRVNIVPVSTVMNLVTQKTIGNISKNHINKKLARKE
ncbi:MAG: divergent polysaccharide deacetylase family protein [Desulfobacterales bacterium]|nr:divergent polysaccharide deacetylase family protein [Desulfobacterales bacterium]